MSRVAAALAYTQKGCLFVFSVRGRAILVDRRRGGKNPGERRRGGVPAQAETGDDDESAPRANGQAADAR